MNECSSFEFLFLPDVTRSPLLWDFLLTLTLVKWLFWEWPLSWNGWMWRQEPAWRCYFPNLGKCQEFGMRIWNKKAKGWHFLRIKRKERIGEMTCLLIWLEAQSSQMTLRVCYRAFWGLWRTNNIFHDPITKESYYWFWKKPKENRTLPVFSLGVI